MPRRSQRTVKPERDSQNNQDSRSSREEDRKSGRKKIVKIAIIAFLTLIAVSMIASQLLDIGILNLPRKVTSAIISPLQNVFSSVSASVSDYFRKIKYRSNLEAEYEKLLSINEDLRNENAVLSDYENKVSALQDLLDLKNEFKSMSPLPATVISHDTGSYFSVLELNVGTEDGVRDFMAVVSDGGLVGYTYDTQKGTCKVRCIIDSDATVAGMLQTSRDQGSINGTLGIDGTAMCRMYYLPETSLPRPGEIVITSGVGMEFPKGIPIGTVRESTRGMEETKSYIVLEPMVDFQHLEYVIVLLYQPSYAEDAQVRTAGTRATLIPLSTAWPVPTFQGNIGSGFATASPTPKGGVTPEPSATPSPTPTAAPSAAPELDPNATPRPTNIVYIPSDPNATPTPSPTPVPTPSPTPMPTFDPNSTMEEDDR